MKLFGLSAHLRDAALCDAFLETAETSYRDMLPTVREEIAKAMGEFLEHFPFRGGVWWSEEDSCFNGRLVGVPFGLVVEFSGHRPSDVQQAFVKAVNQYIEQSTVRREAEALLLDQDQLLTAD